MGMSTAFLAIGLNAAPDSRLETWAKKEAEKELSAELGSKIVAKPEWSKTI